MKATQQMNLFLLLKCIRYIIKTSFSSLNILVQYEEIQFDNGFTSNILSTPPHVLVSLVTRNSRILIKPMLLYRFSKNLKPKMWAPLESLYKIRATERSTIKCYLLCLAKSYDAFWESELLREWNLLLCNLTSFIQVQNDVISQIDIK